MTTAGRAVIGAAIVAACVGGVRAQAGALSFVSVRGTDTGACSSPAAACRTFAYAQNQTSAGGEIIALDPGDYSPVTITKSLSVTGAVAGAGARGGELARSTIKIDAGETDVVHLRGLTLDGLDVRFLTGIYISQAGSVTIKDCVVRNYLKRGLDLNSSSARYLVEDVTISRSGQGIFCRGSCVLDRVSVENGGIGIFVPAGAATVSEASVTGVESGIDGFMRLGRSVVTGNASGLADVLESAGDNFVRGNGTNFLSGPPTMIGRR